MIDVSILLSLLTFEVPVHGKEDNERRLDSRDSQIETVGIRIRDSADDQMADHDPNSADSLFRVRACVAIDTISCERVARFSGRRRPGGPARLVQARSRDPRFTAPTISIKIFGATAATEPDKRGIRRGGESRRFTPVPGSPRSRGPPPLPPAGSPSNRGEVCVYERRNRGAISARPVFYARFLFFSSSERFIRAGTTSPAR